MPARKKKEKEPLIKVYKMDRPSIRVYKTLKDKEGNQMKIVRIMADGILPWMGPWGGHMRLDAIGIDPAIPGIKNLVMGLSLIPPGNELALHSHNLEEGYIVVKGRGLMYTDTGDECEVKWGDCIWNGPNVHHCLRNIGDEPLWIAWAWGGTNIPSGLEELESGGAMARAKKGAYGEQFECYVI